MQKIMPEYNAYGELYDQRPDLVIHDRLRHSGTIKEIVDLAEKHNFNVYFDRGPFRQDMMIKWKEVDMRPAEYSVTAGLRYFKRLDNMN